MTDFRTHDGRSLQQAASDLVQREVLVCLSSMVATLASAYGQADRSDNHLRDLDDLAELAFELAAPVLDYEEAARQAGWHQEDGRWFHGTDHRLHTAIVGCSNAAEACHESDVEPYEWEVYEHWAVSTWLAEKLQAAGERVDTDFAGLNV